MKRNDLILIGAGLLLALVVFGWTQWFQKDTAQKAIVYVDKKEYAEYDLGQNGEYEIKTDRGNNVLVIKDGKADVIEADCPDELCVKQKAISKKGETIVCLPHRLVVEIEADEKVQFDAQSK